jgi:hypothetical protein
MVRSRVVAIGGALLVLAAGCRFLGSGPSDKEIVAAVEKAPPAPPTAGPTYLSDVTSVSIEERGRFNSDGKYWPVRVRVKGGVKSRLTGFLRLALADAVAKEKSQPLEFVEEARLSKDDFGGWRVTYNYDERGPRWRLEEPEASGSRALLQK